MLDPVVISANNSAMELEGFAGGVHEFHNFLKFYSKFLSI